MDDEQRVPIGALETLYRIALDAGYAEFDEMEGCQGRDQEPFEQECGRDKHSWRSALEVHQYGNAARDDDGYERYGAYLARGAHVAEDGFVLARMQGEQVPHKRYGKGAYPYYDADFLRQRDQKRYEFAHECHASSVSRVFIRLWRLFAPPR